MEIDGNGLEVLSRDECMRLLGNADVGRVVITEKALPAALPVNFVVVDGDVLFLTSRGGKLEAAAAGHVVAFEVDEIDPVSRAGWSVLIRGEAGVVEDPDELAAITLPIALPWVHGVQVHVVRIRSELVSGRRHLPAPSGSPPPLGTCPSCGCEALLRVTAGARAHFVCTGCAACWRLGEYRLQRVDVTTCVGCSFKPMCTAAFLRDATLANAAPAARAVELCSEPSV